MARGDFRYTPRFIFWSTIVLFMLIGAGLGWIVSPDQIDATVGILPGGLIGLGVAAWLSKRHGLPQAPTEAEPYEHPVLGLYSGLVAVITLRLLDASWTYSLLTGLTITVLMVGAMVALGRWRKRNDGPNRRRLTSTLTGWR